MAKKRKTASKSSNHRKFINILLLLFVAVCSIGLLWQSNPDYFNAQYRKLKKEFTASQDSLLDLPTPPKKENKKENQKENKKESQKADQPVTANLRSIKGLDTAADLKDRPSEVVRHTGYVVSFNSKGKVPNWVGWELTKVETTGDSKRTNRFIADPKIKSQQATSADYSRSGYDRGHMAPAGDMSWSTTAMKESFYFTNMCPQAPNLNRGIWKSLEDQTREWAKRDSAIYVICGPVIKGGEKTIGPNKVIVPTQFYKVILSPYGKKPKAIGFLFDNDGSLEQLSRFAVSVDSVEKLTGIDFFHGLPDSVENVVEGSFKLNEWF